MITLKLNGCAGIVADSIDRTHPIKTTRDEGPL